MMSIYETDWEGTAMEQMSLRLELQNMLESVVELHKAVQGPYDNLVCNECSHMDIDVDFHTNYPCPTVQALIRPGYCIHDVRMGCEDCWK
jgi:hypothetical protein